MNHQAIPDRGVLSTELANPESCDFSQLDVAGMVQVMQRADAGVITAMQAAAPALTSFIKAVRPHFVAGGRLFLVGAGTSGRLAVLDASEVGPTFCAEPGRIEGIIAGGDRCLRQPSEGAEDDPQGAIAELTRLQVTSTDAVLGIAAGGTTPYVHGAIAFSHQQGAITGLLTCVEVPPPPGCQHVIHMPTGPEVITGSTRLKAGTATKMALNTISTVLFAQAGHVYGNLMIDVRASNVKLRDRAARIIATVTGVDRVAALDALDRAGGSAKTAVVMLRFHVNLSTALTHLKNHQGNLGRALAHQIDT